MTKDQATLAPLNSALAEASGGELRIEPDDKTIEPFVLYEAGERALFLPAETVATLVDMPGGAAELLVWVNQLAHRQYTSGHKAGVEAGKKLAARGLQDLLGVTDLVDALRELPGRLTMSYTATLSTTFEDAAGVEHQAELEVEVTPAQSGTYWDPPIGRTMEPVELRIDGQLAPIPGYGNLVARLLEEPAPEPYDGY